MDEEKAKQLFLLILERLLEYYYLRSAYDLLYLVCKDHSSENKKEG